MPILHSASDSDLQTLQADLAKILHVENGHALKQNLVTSTFAECPPSSLVSQPGSTSFYAEAAAAGPSTFYTEPGPSSLLTQPGPVASSFYTQPGQAPTSFYIEPGPSSLFTQLGPVPSSMITQTEAMIPTTFYTEHGASSLSTQPGPAPTCFYTEPGASSLLTQSGPVASSFYTEPGSSSLFTQPAQAPSSMITQTEAMIPTTTFYTESGASSLFTQSGPAPSSMLTQAGAMIPTTFYTEPGASSLFTQAGPGPTTFYTEPGASSLFTQAGPGPTTFYTEPGASSLFTQAGPGPTTFYTEPGSSSLFTQPGPQPAPASFLNETGHSSCTEGYVTSPSFTQQTKSPVFSESGHGYGQSSSVLNGREQFPANAGGLGPSSPEKSSPSPSFVAPTNTTTTNNYLPGGNHSFSSHKPSNGNQKTTSFTCQGHHNIVNHNKTRYSQTAAATSPKNGNRIPVIQSLSRDFPIFPSTALVPSIIQTTPRTNYLTGQSTSYGRIPTERQRALLTKVIWIHLNPTCPPINSSNRFLYQEASTRCARFF